MKKIGRFAKAVMPSVVSFAGAVTYSLANGVVDKESLIIAGVGVLGSVVTYFVPNAAVEVPAVEAAVEAAPPVVTKAVLAPAPSEVQPLPAPNPTVAPNNNPSVPQQVARKSPEVKQ